MIQKIKDLIRIKEEMSLVSDRFEKHTSCTEELSKSISQLNKEVVLLKQSQNILTQRFVDDSSEIIEIKEELKKEVIDFKLMKSRAEKKMIESFEIQLNENLFPKFEKIQKKTEKFEELADNSEKIGSQIESLSKEIDKFKEIARNIKKEDYELSRFADKLKKEDTEKLELMKRIDQLERLVAKMRKRH